MWAGVLTGVCCIDRRVDRCCVCVDRCCVCVLTGVVCVDRDQHGVVYVCVDRRVDRWCVCVDRDQHGVPVPEQLHQPL